MAIADLIAQGGAFLNLVKKYITSPIVAGVPIEATRFECSMEAEVSRHVLVDLTGGRKFINDNVAPGPRTWEIEGFVGGLPGEVSSLFMPSLFIFRTALELAYFSRKTVLFKDPNAVSYQNVMISRLWYAKQAEVQNRLPIRLTLQELFVLTANPVTNAVESAATPAGGTASGDALAAGVTESVTQSAIQMTTLAGLTLLGAL